MSSLPATHDDAGEVEGVKCDHLSVVFINGFKEQQAQIQRHQEQLEMQRVHKVNSIYNTGGK